MSTTPEWGLCIVRIYYHMLGVKQDIQTSHEYTNQAQPAFTYVVFTLI